MKSKRTAPSRRRISFAVDREDIDVSSDWVEAVMARPVAAPEIATTSHTAPPSDEKNSSKLSTADDGSCDIAVPMEDCSTEPNNSTGELLIRGQNLAGATVIVGSDAERTIPGDNSATVVQNSSVLRRPKPRILNRITDGLTPGQYAVYRVMYEEGESTDDRARIYTGGYADLGRLTGMSKRGIQNVVGELQAKEVIRIHRKPGHRRTETSAYVVPDAKGVVETWLSKGWRYATGKSKVLTA